MGLAKSILKGIKDSLPIVSTANNSIKEEELKKAEDLPLLNKIWKSIDFARLITMITVTILLLKSVFKVQNITFEQLLELLRIIY